MRYPKREVIKKNAHRIVGFPASPKSLHLLSSLRNCQIHQERPQAATRGMPVAKKSLTEALNEKSNRNPYFRNNSEYGGSAGRRRHAAVALIDRPTTAGTI